MYAMIMRFSLVALAVLVLLSAAGCGDGNY